MRKIQHKLQTLSAAERSLLIVIGLAFVLRLLSITILPPRLGDDSPWYLDRGARMMTGLITPQEAITFAPLYAMVAGTANHFLGLDSAILFLRLLQAIIGTATCGLVWRIAYGLTHDWRVATVAGLGIALNPIFIIDDNNIVTEPLFIMLLVWAFAVYLMNTGTKRSLVGSGVLFGLATLTRAMTLLFPVGLGIHLLLILPFKRALRAAALLLVVYGAVLSVWTLYSAVKFDKFVIGASGISDFLLTGTLGYKGSPQVDTQYQNLNDGTVPDGSARDPIAVSVVSSTIGANPVGYLVSQSKKLLVALLQPHMTPYFAGPSLKTMAGDSLRHDRTIAGLGTLISGAYFWPKLALYIAHYLGLLFGALGILFTLREWRKYTPLSGFILYTLLLHLFLLVIPRYLFPILPALWVFAGVAIVRLWDRLRVWQTSHRSQQAQLQTSP